MEHNVELERLVTNVQKLTPSTRRNEIEALVTYMSQRSGICEDKILSFLYEDLQNGIPFQHTSVGKCRTLSHR